MEMNKDQPIPRPMNMRRRSSTNTRYMQMLLGLDDVPRWHNLLVATFSWLLLAGFVISPGTFTPLQKIDPNSVGNGVINWILSSVKNLPLLVIAGVCCVVGTIGLISFWIRWRKNYVWICNRIFLPGMLNGLTGVLSTLINVYTAQDKRWSITARVSIIIEGACLIIFGILFAIYSTWMLRRVKLKHHKEVNEQDLEDGDVSIEKGGQEERYPELHKEKNNDSVEDKNKGEITEERLLESPIREHGQTHATDSDKKEVASMEERKAEEPVHVGDDVDHGDKGEEGAQEPETKAEQPGQEPAKIN
ncbi:hypothetical protein CPB86DRAFT_144680 [Serendipita vermifera]|nr:hypothetical protein CPB86DRAFT_144680 [Serendipita vermifera]